MENYFEIQNFTCGYGNKFHIRNISFQIKSGGFTGIIGPNGSGKTTLFKGITRELKAKSGHILLDGKDVGLMSYRLKAQNLAIVTQQIESVDIRVEDYVLMGRLPYNRKFQFFETKNDIEIAEKYMNLTDTSHLRNKYLNQLSGGEQQLAGIARALTQEPKLLLLDEPTSHLDITHQVQVLNLIQKLNEQFKLTVLMIIHDLNLAGEYCDQLVLLNKGKIHIAGNPGEVLTYKNIEEVYDTVVVTRTNPISKKPVIFLISEKTLNKK